MSQKIIDNKLSFDHEENEEDNHRKPKQKDGKRYGKLAEDVPSTLRLKEKSSKEEHEDILKELAELKHLPPKAGELDESILSDVNFNEVDNLKSLSTNFENFDAAGVTLLSLDFENEFTFINVINNID